MGLPATEEAQRREVAGRGVSYPGEAVDLGEDPALVPGI
jgi:hypothetical protein